MAGDANFAPEGRQSEPSRCTEKGTPGSTPLETLDSLSVRVGSVKFENLNKLLAQNL
jgi:hypothetical protein